MSRGVETPHPHAYPPIENDDRRRDRLKSIFWGVNSIKMTLEVKFIILSLSMKNV